MQEAIYTLLMMRDDFIAASANIEELDPDAEGMAEPDVTPVSLLKRARALSGAVN